MIKFASPLFKNEMKVLRGGDCDGMRHRQSLSTKTISMQDDVSISSPDGVSKVLAGDPHRGPRHADHHGHLVVQLERPVVDVGLLEIEVVGEIAQQMSHGVCVYFELGWGGFLK